MPLFFTAILEQTGQEITSRVYENGLRRVKKTNYAEEMG
jgi:hypothetical protein